MLVAINKLSGTLFLTCRMHKLRCDRNKVPKMADELGHSLFMRLVVDLLQLSFQ